MNSLDPAMLEDALRAIVDAELHCHRSRSRPGTGVSAALQKAALAVLLPYEGEPISNTALADRIGIDPTNVVEVITSLIEQGLITELRERRDRRCYTINVQALKTRKTATPLWHARRYGPAPKTSRVESDGLAELRSILPALGLAPDEAQEIRSRSTDRAIVAKRMALVVHLRESRSMSFPEIAQIIRGSPAKHSTCIVLYRRAKLHPLNVDQPPNAGGRHPE